MGTAKRERQKANRQLRLEELAKQARRDKTKKITGRVTAGALAVVALVGVVYLVGRNDTFKLYDSCTQFASSALPGVEGC